MYIKGNLVYKDNIAGTAGISRSLRIYILKIYKILLMLLLKKSI